MNHIKWRILNTKSRFALLFVYACMCVCVNLKERKNFFSRLQISLEINNNLTNEKKFHDMNWLFIRWRYDDDTQNKIEELWNRNDVWSEYFLIISNLFFFVVIIIILVNLEEKIKWLVYEIKKEEDGPDKFLLYIFLVCIALTTEVSNNKKKKSKWWIK